MAHQAKLQAKAFDPKSPSYRWRLWVRFPGTQSPVYIYWRRLGVVSAAALALGWLGLVTGVWAVMRYSRGFAEARWYHLATPWNWPGYRAELGETYSRRAVAELQKKDTAGAYNDLVAAVGLDPGNLHSRHLLAAIEVRAGMGRDALATLRGGVAKAANKFEEGGYLRDYFALAFELQANAEVMATAQSVLPATADRMPAHQFIAYQAADAAYNRHLYAEAERWLEAWNLQRRPEGEILRAQCEWAQGLHRQAVARLSGDLGRFANRDPFWLALEKFARASGHWDEVRRFAVQRELAAPQKPQIRVDVIEADHHLGLGPEEAQDIDSYLSDFRSDQNALAPLAKFAVASAQPALAQRIRRQAGGRNSDPANLDLAVAMATLAARDYSGAILALRPFDRPGFADNRTLGAVIAGLRALALLGQGNSAGNLAWSDFLEECGNLRPADSSFFEQTLQGMGREKEAKQLVEQGAGTDRARYLATARQAVAAGDYPAALRAIGTAESAASSGGDALEAWLAGLKAVAMIGKGDGAAPLAWTNLMGQAGRLRTADRAFLSDRLKTIGREKESVLLANLGNVPGAAPDLRAAREALRAADYPSALKQLAAIRSATPAGDEAFEADFAGLESVSLWGEGSEAAPLAWSNFLSQAPLVPRPERDFLAARLKTIGRAREAQEMTDPSGHPYEAPDLEKARAAIRIRDYGTAWRMLQGRESSENNPNRASAAEIAGLKAIALWGQGNEAAGLAWTNFWAESANLPSADLEFITVSLTALGREGEVRQLRQRLREKGGIVGQTSPKAGR